VSPNNFGKLFSFGRKTENKWRFIWKFARLFISLQRQNVCFDYAAECGEYQNFNNLTRNLVRALTAAGITIPFPQCDVHLIHEE
jgi:hypothetical protein